MHVGDLLAEDGDLLRGKHKARTPMSGVLGGAEAEALLDAPVDRVQVDPQGGQQLGVAGLGARKHSLLDEPAGATAALGGPANRTRSRHWAGSAAQAAAPEVRACSSPLTKTSRPMDILAQYR